MFRPLPTIAALILLGGAVALAKPTLQSSAPAFSPDPISSSDPQGVAQSPAAPPIKQRGMGWLRDLDLSADQMQKIRSIRGQYQDKLMSQRQAARQAQRELRILMAGDASVEEIRQKYREVQTLHQQVADTQFNSMLEMRQVLTPQQRQKFAERMEQRRGNPGMRRPGMGKDL
ncbi:Spy/CpxP family protein refolding chaperone [Phormidesmis priestleyi]